MKKSWKRLTAFSLAVGAGLAFATPPARAAEAEAEDPNTGALTFVGGVDYTTAYFFRGYNQEDARLIFQPYAELYFNVVDSDNLKVTPFVGVWSSVHEQETPGDDSIYETDYYAGVDFGFGESPLTLRLIYTAYTYPGDAFESIQELGAKLSFDDTKLMERLGVPFALKPYVGVFKEISDRNAEVVDEAPAIFANDGTQDTYLEFGAEPTLPLLGENSPVTLSLPVVVGCSLDDYYEDDTGDNEFLGYVRVGLKAAAALPLPARYGAWTVYGKVDYLHLFADSVQDLNEEPEDGGIGSGDDGVVIGTVGVSFTY